MNLHKNIIVLFIMSLCFSTVLFAHSEEPIAQGCMMCHQNTAHPKEEKKEPPKQDNTIEALKQHVAFLTQSELQGRLTGSPGEARATQYIADHFTRLNLKPISNEANFFQNFTFTPPDDKKKDFKHVMC